MALKSALLFSWAQRKPRRWLDVRLSKGEHSIKFDQLLLTVKLRPIVALVTDFEVVKVEEVVEVVKRAFDYRLGLEHEAR